MLTMRPCCVLVLVWAWGGRGWWDGQTSSDLKVLWRAGGVGVVGTLKSKQHQGKAENPKERWKWAKKPAQVPPPP